MPQSIAIVVCTYKYEVGYPRRVGMGTPGGYAGWVPHGGILWIWKGGNPLGFMISFFKVSHEYPSGVTQ